MYIISLLVRSFLCIIPYLILISNQSIIYHITGPITIPPFNESIGHLIYWIAAIELFRVFYGAIVYIILKLVPKKAIKLRTSFFFKSLTIRYGIVLIMKLLILFYEYHRFKYYLHVFFLELFIIAVNVLADVVDNHKVSLVMEIVLIDGLNRVAIFYELTRTFNPNFGLYFFGNSLLTLICYMLEGDRKLVLYVRHDIYRIMIVTFGYLFMFSLFQLSITSRPLIIFALTAYFFYLAIQQFSSEQIELPQAVEQKKRPKKGVDHFIDIAKFQVIQKEPEPTKNYFGDIRWYIEMIKKKKALLNFLIVVSITISIELFFIYTQPNDERIETSLNANQFQEVGESYPEYYQAIKEGRNSSTPLNEVFG